MMQRRRSLRMVDEMRSPLRRLIATRAGGARMVTTASTKPRLWSNPRSRGKIVEWWLKELGAEYDIVDVDVSTGEHKGEALRSINPFAKLPAMQDGNLKLFESGALLLYLDEKYREKSSMEERALNIQWCLFANSTMGNALFLKDNQEKQMPQIMDTLNQIFSDCHYLVDDTFGVADVAVGSYLLYLPLFFPDLDLTPWTHVGAYMERLKERQAYKETLGARIDSMPPPSSRT